MEQISTRLSDFRYRLNPVKGFYVFLISSWHTNPVARERLAAFSRCKRYRPPLNKITTAFEVYVICRTT